MSLTKVGEKHFSVVNHCVPRIDGVDKSNRKGALRSGHIYGRNALRWRFKGPYSSARVVSIDAAKAKAIPGVEAVVTCFDMPRTRSWAGYMYLTDTIRYSGDCVAMVAAQSKELVDEALEAIHAEYEELPGVYTIEEALSEGAFAVHEKYPDNIFKRIPCSISAKGTRTQHLKKADIVLEREYRTQYIEHSYIEPEACIYYLNPNDGAMTVHSASQNPFFTRRYVADVLGVPMNQVRMVQETLGGTFGGKEEGAGLVAGRCAYLCSLTKKPVKFVFNREDSFLESAKRHPFRLRYKAGITKRRTDRGLAGASRWITAVPTTTRPSSRTGGPMSIQQALEELIISRRIHTVCSQIMYTPAPREATHPLQLIWAQEQFIEELAMACGMDELEFHRKEPSPRRSSDSHRRTRGTLRNPGYHGRNRRADRLQGETRCLLKTSLREAVSAEVSAWPFATGVPAWELNLRTLQDV